MILSSALGSVGTYLVLIVALVLGAVCITEKSLVSLVKKGSGRAYEYAREDMNRETRNPRGAQGRAKAHEGGGPACAGRGS